MYRPAYFASLGAVGLLMLAAPSQAASPETFGVFDWPTSRVSLFNDHADGVADESVDLKRRGRHRVFPVAGDWNGDGVTDLGFYNPYQHVFELLSDRKDGAPDVMIPVPRRWGWFKPVSGDWDGDGKDDLGLYDPLARRFSLLSPSGNGQVFRTVQFSGRRPWHLKPFAGDWDGDGVAELGLYDAHDGSIYLLRSKATGDREVVLRSSETTRHLRPVAADFDGDGDDELALFDRHSRHFAMLKDLADGKTDSVFDVAGSTSHRLWPLAGRWTAEEPGGPDNDVPDTAHCQPAAGVDPAVAAFETAVLSLVNERRAAGAVCGSEGTYPPAPALSMEPALRCSARLHVRDMASRNVASQDGANGSLPEMRMGEAGYAVLFGAESVAAGPPDPTSLVNAWMADGETCSLLLDPGFEDAGVGFVDSGAGQRFFWVLDYAAPQ